MNTTYNTLKRVHLVNNLGYHWFQKQCEEILISTKGFLLANGEVFRDEKFADIIAKYQEKIDSFLASADGFFSVVIETGEQVFAWTDHMRAFPIFWYQDKDSEFILTDCLDLKKMKETHDFDSTQLLLLESTMFTWKEETLLKGVYSLPAGNALVLDAKGGRTHPYWEFHYEENQISNMEEADELLGRSYKETFSLCKNVIEGRTVIVPLSGGYDSRLVLNELLHAGIPSKQIIAFTYGKSETQDVKISKKIAHALGVTHCFINYCTKEAKKFYQEKAEYFFKYAGNAVSLPCFQEWYAVHKLKEQGVIDHNCVFVNGYGGILPGHYISNRICTSKRQELSTIGEEWRNNFIISRWFSERKADEIYTEFLQSSGFSDLSDNANYTEAYEKWIYTEEQSKFIMNAVRDYEEVDCEWITPFFFKQQFNCWAKISNSLRVNNAAFIQCMDHFWDERIRDIEFVGSKVKNKRSIKYRVSMGLYMLFAPTKYHYLFALISRKKYYSYLLRYGRANINHLIVKDYVDWVCNL